MRPGAQMPPRSGLLASERPVPAGPMGGRRSGLVLVVEVEPLAFQRQQGAGGGLPGVVADRGRGGAVDEGAQGGDLLGVGAAERLEVAAGTCDGVTHGLSPRAGLAPVLPVAAAG